MMCNNIILITVDCFRYDRCGFNGYQHQATPFLDKLSSESIIFDSAFATGPYTPESFPGIFAGLHANSTSYMGDLICKSIPSNTQTITSQLRKEGFDTLATVSNPHLSPDRNFDYGFDQYQNLRLKTSPSMVEKKSKTPEKGILDKVRNFFEQRLEEQAYYPNPYVLPYLVHRCRQFNNWPTIDGEKIRTELISQLERYSNTEDPTFAWCHFNDAHAPIHPLKSPKVHDVGGPIRQLSADSARIANTKHSRCSKMYDNALRYIDTQIKLIFDGLSNMSLLDNTAVIVVGDHGEGLGEHGVYNHPWHYMYDTLLHVPLLIWTSNRETQNRVSAPFSLAWLHEIISKFSGSDFGSFPTEGQGDPFVDTYRGPVVADSVSPFGYSIAIRDGDNKYLNYDISDVEYHTHCDVFNRNSVCLDLSTGSDEDTAEFGIIEGEINTLIEDHQTDPQQVPEMSDNISRNSEHRLKQLGYLG